MPSSGFRAVVRQVQSRCRAEQSRAGQGRAGAEVQGAEVQKCRGSAEEDVQSRCRRAGSEQVLKCRSA